MPAANTDKLRKTRQRFSTTLSSGVGAADTTLPCASLSGVPTDTAVDVVLNRVDSNGTVQAIWETVTAVASGSNLTNALRGVEGTASAWGAGTVVEILWTAAQWNDAVDAFLEEHDQDGSHGSITGSSVTVTGDIETSAGAVITDTVSEKTSAAGVTVDSLLIKDGRVVHWDGWSSAEETWTYASATAFTIAGVDRTARYKKGTKIKLTQGTDKYFVVASTSFSTDTTVNLIPTTDYSLANEAITAPLYSYAQLPAGYPTYFAYTPTVTPGGSMTLTSADHSGYWWVVGNVITLFVSARGTLGGTPDNTITVSLPVPTGVAGRWNGSGIAFNSDSNWRTGSIYTGSSVGQTTAACIRWDWSNFTTGGGSGFRGSITYPF